MSYVLAVTHVYLMLRKCYDVYVDLKSQTRKDSTNALLYMSLFQQLSYATYVLSTTYAQCFNHHKLCKFVNEILSFSKEYNTKTKSKPPHLSRGKWKSQAVTVLLGIFITVVAMLGFLMADDFSYPFTTTLEEVQYLFFRKEEVKDILSSFDNIYVWIGVFTSLVHGMRDIYFDMFFMSGVVTLWLMSLSFRRTVSEELETFRENQRKQVKLRSLKMYRSIFHITHDFDRGHGLAMLCYFFEGLMYYSINLNVVFVNRGFGPKIFYIKYFLLFWANFGLGVHFSINVTTKVKNVKLVLIGCLELLKNADLFFF